MRLVSAIVLAAFLCNVASPLPVLAMSTQAEIAKGADISKQIDRQSLLVDDPFLTTWVNGVGDNLAKYRARQDITYSFKIINSNEINAFALPGGFLHVDMGLLNTVSSDDELAGVMAHEMGHVERGHVVTLEEKGNILGILIGILSILSPLTSLLGGYGGDLAMNKFSRQDELQADQYGLQLMSRAGYDPQSMVDFMDQLRQLSETMPESKADKAFQDHPVPSDRISHLMGYPQLDNPSATQITADAIHDETEGRFSYAQMRFQQALRVQPNEPQATQHLAAVEVALKDVAPAGQMQFAFALDPAGRASTASLIQQALNITHDDALAAAEQEKWGNRDAEALYTQLNSLSGGVPNLGHPKTPTNNLATAIAALDRMVVDVNGSLDSERRRDVVGARPVRGQSHDAARDGCAAELDRASGTAGDRRTIPRSPRSSRRHRTSWCVPSTTRADRSARRATASSCSRITSSCSTRSTRRRATSKTPTCRKSKPPWTRRRPAGIRSRRSRSKPMTRSTPRKAAGFRRTSPCST